MREDGVLATTVVSSFEAQTGALLGHTFLDFLGGRFAVGATGLAPDETVALAGAVEGEGPDDPWWTAVVLYRSDTQQATLVKLAPTGDTSAAVGVGWDGEAFAAHFFDGGTLKVARVSKEGKVVLPVTEFGQPGGSFDWLRVKTDAVSGVSVSLSTSGGIWVTGHTREGTALPKAGKVEGRLVEAQGKPAGVSWPEASDHADLGVYGGGFLAVLSGNCCTPSTIIQPLGVDLWPSADARAIEATQVVPGVYESYRESTVVGSPEETWLYGMEAELGVREVHVKGGEVTKRTVIPRTEKTSFLGRIPSAVQWQGERWLGYVDHHAETVPLRIVRAREDCTYP
jgi:hypothetical protein